MISEPEQVLVAEGKPEPEINPLIPDGIEKFRPRCIVCTEFVPAKRSTGRSKDTCSPECHKVLRMYRKHCVQKTRCPACFHPATSEERELFKKWRRERGELRNGRGRPPKIGRVEQLINALSEAVEVFREYRQELIEVSTTKDEQGNSKLDSLEEIDAKDVAVLEERIGRFEKLIDTKGTE